MTEEIFEADSVPETKSINKPDCLKCANFVKNRCKVIDVQFWSTEDMTRHAKECRCFAPKKRRFLRVLTETSKNASGLEMFVGCFYMPLLFIYRSLKRWMEHK